MIHYTRAHVWSVNENTLHHPPPPSTPNKELSHSLARWVEGSGGSKSWRQSVLWTVPQLRFHKHCPRSIRIFPMPREPAAPRAPAHLQKATRDWFVGVMADYVLEPHHVRLLTLAAEAWDRSQQAREALATGLTFTDRFGAPHARPEIAIERDSRTAFARLVRELDLDTEPPAAGKRPPGLRSNRRG